MGSDGLQCSGKARGRGGDKGRGGARGREEVGVKVELMSVQEE